ncbi:MAG: HAMP domain-containing histidine kinase [Lachnospiraceae bacterium]|nr:HAMP domain-containing histidine kinase [Lachnospiraceae bacterium]
MATAQKLFLGIAVVCYALVLFNFMHGDLWMILVFFILHSICLILFSYLSYEAKVDKKAMEDLIEELARTKAEKEEISESLTQQLSGKSTQLMEAERSLLETTEELNTMKQEVSELNEREEARIQKEQLEEKRASEMPALESLLPPLPYEADDHETIDIISICKETIKDLAPYAEQAKLQVVISAPESSLLVKASPSRLRILFRNIIDNSIKYMRRAGSLIITISNIGDDIFIVLKDNGNGLSPNETEHIFELNYQGSNRISGNGLGLTQAKAIVTYYGGTIYAKSTIGQGMGIYIQLPTT